MPGFLVCYCHIANVTLGIRKYLKITFESIGSIGSLIFLNHKKMEDRRLLFFKMYTERERAISDIEYFQLTPCIKSCVFNNFDK